ncbi:hypothetical protein BC351_03445 [Paenibacillus ferrarius]|uniref:Uncharacterized protein n=1 Tax=Paenibacillus ferrarius TaxID=1469647 RepID=A0A1V4HK11_9BACL|nr:hypothetical protein [Paenibacillus ferrarius]OPH57590.1 hypothetical protein BC351_03445 [Paenibacillus ferrarius]
MRGIIIFIGIIILNLALFISTSIYGMVIVDFSFIITLLIVLYDDQKGILHKFNKRKESESFKSLIKQREQSEEQFDVKDLPSLKDIEDMNNQKD